LKYRLHGKENRFSIGAYPDIGLKEARDIARGARRDVANRIAPLKAKTAKIEAQLLNEERTFEYVAKQWLTFKSAELVTKSISGFSGVLSNHILPAIGNKPVSEIKLEHITTIITELRRQRIMAMARRVRTIIRSILGLLKHILAEVTPAQLARTKSFAIYAPAAVTSVRSRSMTARRSDLLRQGAVRLNVDRCISR
jgi:integrase